MVMFASILDSLARQKQKAMLTVIVLEIMGIAFAVWLKAGAENKTNVLLIAIMLLLGAIMIGEFAAQGYPAGMRMLDLLGTDEKLNTVVQIKIYTK